ncbi:MAG: hypothetical protein ACI94Y_002336 [Maribacter sp.]
MKLNNQSIGFLCYLLVLISIFGFQIQVGLPVVLGLPTQPFAIAYRSLPLFLSIILILAVLIRTDQKKVTYGVFLLLVFWVLYSARVIYDIGFRDLNLLAYPSQSKLYYFLYVFGSGFLPAVAIALTAKFIDFKKYGWMVLAFLGLQILVSIYLIYSNANFLSEQLLKYRIGVRTEEGNVLNPITLGKYGTVAFLVGFSHLFSKIKKSILSIILYFTYIIVGLVFISLGGSRGPLLSMFFGILLLLYFHFHERRVTSMFIAKWVSGVVIFVFTVALTIVPKVNPNDIALIYRINETINSSGEGKEERNYAWESAWNQFVDNPILGDQMFEKVYWQYPHNVILEGFMATGLFGGLVFLCLYLFDIKNLIKLRENTHAYISVAPFCIVLLIGSMFSGGLYFNSELWAVLGLLAGYKLELQT